MEERKEIEFPSKNLMNNWSAQIKSCVEDLFLLKVCWVPHANVGMFG
jgi:hypothetical protein